LYDFISKVQKASQLKKEEETIKKFIPVNYQYEKIDPSTIKSYKDSNISQYRIEANYNNTLKKVEILTTRYEYEKNTSRILEKRIKELEEINVGVNEKALKANEMVQKLKIQNLDIAKQNKSIILEKENDLLRKEINEYRSEIRSTKEILNITIRQVETLKLSKELHKDELQTMH
jgi:hypothetical protein